MTPYESFPPRHVARKPTKATWSWWQAGLVTLLVGLIIVIVAAKTIGGPDTGNASNSGPGIVVRTVNSRPVTTTATAPPTEIGDIKRARYSKPLKDLVPGDRVLYDAGGPDRPLCHFMEWFGSIATAHISCPGLPELEVATGFLTSVERVDDQGVPLIR